MDQRFDICLYESTTTKNCTVSFILVLAYILKLLSKLLFGSHEIFFIHACQPLALSFKGRLFSQQLTAFLLVSVLSTWKRKDVRATTSIGGNSPTGGFQGVGVGLCRECEILKSWDMCADSLHAIYFARLRVREQTNPLNSKKRMRLSSKNRSRLPQFDGRSPAMIAPNNYWRTKTPEGWQAPGVCKASSLGVWRWWRHRDCEKASSVRQWSSPLVPN